MAEAQGTAADDGALDALITDARPRMARVLARFRIPPEDADDLIQDTLIHFLRKRDSVQDARKWLVGALRNQCLMYWRSRRRRITVAVDRALMELAADRQPPRQEQKILRKNLEKLIHDMQWRCRELLRLRYGLGYNAEETAARMGYKRSSIDKVARRCLDALGRRLIASSIVRLPRKE